MSLSPIAQRDVDARRCLPLAEVEAIVAQVECPEHGRKCAGPSCVERAHHAGMLNRITVAEFLLIVPDF